MLWLLHLASIMLALQTNVMAMTFPGISQTLRYNQENGVVACEKLNIFILKHKLMVSVGSGLTPCFAAHRTV